MPLELNIGNSANRVRTGYLTMTRFGIQAGYMRDPMLDDSSKRPQFWSVCIFTRGI